MTDTKAIPRGHDTRAGVRRLLGVVAKLAKQIQQLRLDVRVEAIRNILALDALRGEIRKLACQTVPHEAALSGPYWEARAKALYDRGQEALEPTYPERVRGIEEKLSIRGEQGDWPNIYGPREG